MYSQILITLSVLSNIAPEPNDNNYNLIIIPILKDTRTNVKNMQTKKYMNSEEIADRIDMEQYDDPKQMPDIDNFDYTKDKDDYLREREEIIIDKNDLFKLLLSKTEAYKNRFKHQTSDLNANLKAGDYAYEYDTNYGENKIVGGQEVDINLYPYHVAYGTNCGGAIIDKKWVITAGHCGKKTYIRVGSKYTNQGTKVAVKHSYIHPAWPAKNKEHPFDYDFQLLELSEYLKFDDNIQPVKIAHLEDMVIGKIVTVTGWGNTHENGPYSNVLRAVRVPIISKEHCQHVPFPYFRGGLTARMFCAGYSEGKKDACQGDSGGPAVSNDRLLGMVSFGYGCATPGSYGVYSKVAKVRPWIEEVTDLKLD